MLRPDILERSTARAAGEMPAHFKQESTMNTTEYFGLEWSNLTPHSISLDTTYLDNYHWEGPQVFPTSGQVARVVSDPHWCGGQQGIGQFRSHVDGQLADLPEPQNGVVFIVSLICLMHPACDGRGDVVAPGTGPDDGCVRDADGRPKSIYTWVRPRIGDGWIDGTDRFMSNGYIVELEPGVWLAVYERNIHVHLEAHRLRGEWFAPHGELPELNVEPKKPRLHPTLDDSADPTPHDRPQVTELKDS